MTCAIAVPVRAAVVRRGRTPLLNGTLHAVH